MKYENNTSEGMGRVSVKISAEYWWGMGLVSVEVWVGMRNRGFFLSRWLPFHFQ